MRKSVNLSTVFLSLVLFLGFIPPVSGIGVGDWQSAKTELVASHRVSTLRTVSYYDPCKKFETASRNEYYFTLKWYSIVVKTSLDDNSKSLLIIENQTRQQYLSVPYRNNDTHPIFFLRG
jgi:hypothetical protein